MKIELHSHTHYSHQTKVFFDGVNSPKEMVAAAARKGLDAIVISDHDTMQGYSKAKAYAKKYGIMVFRGEEVTSRDGHILALGISEVIRPHLSAEETVDLVHGQGGIAISTHPFDIKQVGLREKARICDAVEVFNAQNLDRISNIRARNFVAKYGLPETAGSDAHSTDMIGHGFIHVNATDMDGIMKMIKKNKATLHMQYMPLNIIRDVAVRRLQLSYDYVLDYIDANYWLPKRFVAKKMLSLVNHYPGKITSLFRLFTYLSLGGVITYSLYKTAQDKASRSIFNSF